MSPSLEFLAGRVAMAAEQYQGLADLQHGLREGFREYLEQRRAAGFPPGDMPRLIENAELLATQAATLEYLREVHDRAKRNFIHAALRNQRKGRP